MFDVNHGCAFTVRASARIPAAAAARRGRGGLCLSGWLQRVPKAVKTRSRPPGDRHLVPAGHKLPCRAVRGEQPARSSSVRTCGFSLWLKGLFAT